MRLFPLALILLLTLAVSSVRGTPASHAGRFRVATFNIYKGADLDDHYDLDRTIRTIAAFDADIVGVQEVLRNHASFGCDDQPARITAGLRRLTRKRWNHVFERAWITENRSCLDAGRGDGTETEGLALFTTDRILSSQSIRLSEGRIGLAVRLASMPSLSVVVTHLSSARADQAGRAAELRLLLPWIGKLGSSVLVGDFNALPDATELSGVHSRYRDAWRDAADRGLTLGIETGATRPGRRLARIDYVFVDPAAPLELAAVDVVDTATDGLVEASDHRPVVATFRRMN